MSWTGCDETAWWLTHALEDTAVSTRVRKEMDAGAHAPSLVRAIALDLSAHVKERVERELLERSGGRHWRDPHSAGNP